MNVYDLPGIYDPAILKGCWEADLYQSEQRLKRLTSALSRRRSPLKRLRLMARITNCEARIAALKLAYR